VKLRKEISLLEKEVNSHRNQKELPTPKRNRRTSEEPISKLEAEKEELEQQLKKLEESAVSIIMEKEKRILELEEQIKEAPEID
jgi:predicted Rossmann fold nucleotide-binding protein DprA/Smf involved in DNA uptake